MKDLGPHRSGRWRRTTFNAGAAAHTAEATWAKAAERRIGDCNAKNLTDTAWGVVTAGQTDAHLPTALTRAAERRMGNFNAQELTKNISVCVIGAGVAALTAAKRLLRHGLQVRLVGYCGKNQDGSGVKLGGRLYTEDWDLKAHRMKGPWKVAVAEPSEKCTIRFDAGCQFFTASEPAFCDEVSHWQQAGAVEVWEGARVGSLANDGQMTLIAAQSIPELFCGNGGMSKIIDLLVQEIGEDKIIPHIAQRLLPGSHKRFVLEYQEIVTASSYLDFVGGNLPQDRVTRQTEEEFDYVVLAQGLAANQPRMVNFQDPDAQQVIDCLKQNVRFQNIHVLSLAFNVQLPLPADVFVVEGCVELALVVHTSAKPGMSCASGQDVWTIFSTPEFARDCALPKQKAEALKKMQEAFFQHLHLQEFRSRLVTKEGTPFGLLWPHGRCTTSAQAPTQALFHKEACVGVCGDYCAGAPCLEAAVLSAIAVADAVALHESGAALPPTVRTDLQMDWEPVPLEIPWIIAHYPGLPSPPLKAPTHAIQPVSKYCCPTHDWLGCHPGLIFRNPAGYGLAKAGNELAAFGSNKDGKSAKGHGKGGKSKGKSKTMQSGTQSAR